MLMPITNSRLKYTFEHIDTCTRFGGADLKEQDQYAEKVGYVSSQPKQIHGFFSNSKISVSFRISLLLSCSSFPCWISFSFSRAEMLSDFQSQECKHFFPCLSKIGHWLFPQAFENGQKRKKHIIGCVWSSSLLTVILPLTTYCEKGW